MRSKYLRLTTGGGSSGRLSFLTFRCSAAEALPSAPLPLPSRACGGGADEEELELDTEGGSAHLRPRSAFCTSAISARPAKGPEAKSTKSPTLAVECLRARARVGVLNPPAVVEGPEDTGTDVVPQWTE